MSIRVIRYNTIHYHATCDQCDFSAAIGDDKLTIARAAVLRAVRKHVKATRHEVVVESASHTRYEWRKDKP